MSLFSKVLKKCLDQLKMEHMYMDSSYKEQHGKQVHKDNKVI